MDTQHLIAEVSDLAQRIRLNAINLAVAAAKVKLSRPSFGAANERIVLLVTRATEVASRVDRLSRQLSGDAQELDQTSSSPDSLEQLEACLRDVGEISDAVIAEIKILHDRTRARA
jgi:hypothetical protein